MTAAAPRLEAVLLRERFLEKVRLPWDPTHCWQWLGHVKSNGYAAFHVKRKAEHAHRVSYQLFVGPIPEDKVLDHLCRNRACVNPFHLEPVTQRENILRGNNMAARHARATHCTHGHAYTPENTITRPDTGTRRCRTCRTETNRRAKARQRTAA